MKNILKISNFIPFILLFSKPNQKLKISVLKNLLNSFLLIIQFSKTGFRLLTRNQTLPRYNYLIWNYAVLKIISIRKMLKNLTHLKKKPKLKKFIKLLSLLLRRMKVKILKKVHFFHSEWIKKLFSPIKSLLILLPQIMKSKLIWSEMLKSSDNYLLNLKKFYKKLIKNCLLKNSKSLIKSLKKKNLKKKSKSITKSG